MSQISTFYNNTSYTRLRPLLYCVCSGPISKYIHIVRECQLQLQHIKIWGALSKLYCILRQLSWPKELPSLKLWFWHFVWWFTGSRHSACSQIVISSTEMQSIFRESRGGTASVSELTLASVLQSLDSFYSLLPIHFINLVGALTGHLSLTQFRVLGMDLLFIFLTIQCGKKTGRQIFTRFSFFSPFSE